MFSIKQNIITPLKTRLRIRYMDYKYKSGYLHSTVPKSFLQKKGLKINKNVSIPMNINMGNYIFIGSNTDINNCSSIGSFSCISFDVKIGVVNHALDHISINPIFYIKERGWKDKTTYKNDKTGEIKIGADVLISTNVVVIEGVSIGTGAVIAAGAVVTKDVPPYAIVGGVPAKVIKYRFNEKLRKKLLDSHWWEQPKEKLVKYSAFFNKPETFVEQIKI